VGLPARGELRDSPGILPSGVRDRYHDRIIVYLGCDPFKQDAKRHLESAKATNPYSRP